MWSIINWTDVWDDSFLRSPFKDVPIHVCPDTELPLPTRSTNNIRNVSDVLLRISGSIFTLVILSSHAKYLFTIR